MNRFRLASLPLCLAAGACIGAPIDMSVDPAQSSIDLSINIDVGVADDTDTDSSPLSGSIQIELDDAGAPTQITLNDLFISIDNTLNFNWSFGFFGSADSTLSNGAVGWALGGAPVGPMALSMGDFTLPAVPLTLQGTLDANYDIFLVGAGSVSQDLAGQGDFASDISGTLTVSNDTITLVSTIPLDGTTPLTDDSGNQIGTLTVSGSASIVATAPLPGCAADLTGDGVLDFFDVSAFLSAYSAMDPSADFDGDGSFDFFDVSAFLNAFTAGCP